MTKLLEQAIETARRLPADDQDDIARAIIELTGIGDAGQVTLTPDERAAIENSKAAAARGEFATDEEVSAVWAKRRR
jgi:predicted transcriptional regulator